MNVLVICQYYAPEPFRISDICEELVKRGHEVTVVAGVPNYPMGIIYDDYKHGKCKDEVINGVKIHRCFTFGRRTGTIFRLLNYYSYMFSSCAYVSKLEEDYDVVFVNQLSPVMMANAGIKYKKKNGKKLVVYCLDLWPESLISGGVGRDSVIYKYYHWVSKCIYKKADKIIVTSKSFKDYFAKEFGFNPNEIGYLPQYSEDFFSAESCKKKPDGKIDVMFAGNIGTAQSVETIIRAANETKDIEDLRWHIVGDGSALVDCYQLAQSFGLGNVIFHGRIPVANMPQYYAMADVMLVTLQNDPILSLTLPGKMQTYMASGKFIIGAINGEAQTVIKEAQCGYCAGAEDYVGLADCVRKFCSNSKGTLYSMNALDYYNREFSKHCVIERLIRHLCFDQQNHCEVQKNEVISGNRCSHF